MKKKTSKKKPYIGRVPTAKKTVKFKNKKKSANADKVGRRSKYKKSNED